MYTIKYTKRFEKGAARCKKEGRNMEELKETVLLLKENGSLPESYNPHMLSGVYAGSWEAHIEDDWLIIWREKENEMELLLTATGTHKQLFGIEN